MTNEQQLWGVGIEDLGGVSEEKSYGREVFKQRYYDQTLMCPYNDFPLFSREN